MPSAPAAPASAYAPSRGKPDPPPEPSPQPAGPTSQASTKTPPGPIAVVSLLLGRRRAPRHWLIEAHGDPAGLAARLQHTLAEFAASPSPSANAATNTSTNARASAEAGTEERASPEPANGARTQARPIASSQAGANPRAESSPGQLLQRAFSDCTALDRPDPPSEASYRYRLSLPSGRLGSASLACWRRYSPGGTWQRRCGPMGLTHFLAHHGRQPAQSKSVHLY